MGWCIVHCTHMPSDCDSVISSHFKSQFLRSFLSIICIVLSRSIAGPYAGGGRWVRTNPPPLHQEGGVRWSNVTLSLAAVLYTCQEMQYTGTLQTRAYQKAEQLEVQLEGRACVLLMHLLAKFSSSNPPILKLRTGLYCIVLACW